MASTLNSTSTSVSSMEPPQAGRGPNDVVVVPIPLPPSQREHCLRSYFRCLIAAQACALSKCRESSRILRPRALRAAGLGANAGERLGESGSFPELSSDPLQQASFVAEEDELSAFIGADSPPWSAIFPHLTEISLHRLLSTFEDLVAVEESFTAWKQVLFTPPSESYPELRRVLHCSLALRCSRPGQRIPALARKSDPAVAAGLAALPPGSGNGNGNGGQGVGAAAFLEETPDELKFKPSYKQRRGGEGRKRGAAGGRALGSPESFEASSRLGKLVPPPAPFAASGDTGSPSYRIEEDETAASVASQVRDTMYAVASEMKRAWEQYHDRMHKRAVQAEQYALQEHGRYAARQQDERESSVLPQYPPTPTPSVSSDDLISAALSCRQALLSWHSRRRLQLELDNEHLLPWFPRLWTSDEGAKLLKELLLGGVVPLRETASIVRWSVRNQVNTLSKNRLKGAISKALGLEGALELFRYGRSSNELYDPFSGSLLPAPPPLPPVTPPLLSLAVPAGSGAMTAAPPAASAVARGPAMGLPARQPYLASQGPLASAASMPAPVMREESGAVTATETEASGKTSIVHSDTSAGLKSGLNGEESSGKPDLVEREISAPVSSSSLSIVSGTGAATPSGFPAITRPADPLAAQAGTAVTNEEEDDNEENLVIGAEDAEKERQMAHRSGKGVGVSVLPLNALPPIPVVVGREVVGGNEVEDKKAVIALATQLSGAKAPIVTPLPAATTKTGQPSQPPSQQPPQQPQGVSLFVKTPPIPSPAAPNPNPNDSGLNNPLPSQHTLPSSASYASLTSATDASMSSASGAQRKKKAQAAAGLLSVGQLAAYNESPLSEPDEGGEFEGRTDSGKNEQRKKKMRREPSQGGPSPAMIGAAGGGGSFEAESRFWPSQPGLPYGLPLPPPTATATATGTGTTAMGALRGTGDFHLLPAFSFRSARGFLSPSPPPGNIHPFFAKEAAPMMQSKRDAASTALYFQQQPEQQQPQQQQHERFPPSRQPGQDESPSAGPGTGVLGSGSSFAYTPGPLIPSAAAMMMDGEQARMTATRQLHQPRYHGSSPSYASAPAAEGELSILALGQQGRLQARHRAAATAPALGREPSIDEIKAAFARGGVASRTVAYLETGVGHGPHSGGDMGLHPSVVPAKGGAASVAALATAAAQKRGASNRSLAVATGNEGTGMAGTNGGGGAGGASTPSHSSMLTFSHLSVGAIHPPHAHELHGELHDVDGLSDEASETSSVESPSLADATKDAVGQHPEKKRKLKQLGIALSAYAAGGGLKDTMALIDADEQQSRQRCVLHAPFSPSGRSEDMCPICGVSPSQDVKDEGERKREARKTQKQARMAEQERNIATPSAALPIAAVGGSAPSEQQGSPSGVPAAKKKKGGLFSLPAIPAKLKSLFGKPARGEQSSAAAMAGQQVSHQDSAAFRRRQQPHQHQQELLTRSEGFSLHEAGQGTLTRARSRSAPAFFDLPPPVPFPPAAVLVPPAFHGFPPMLALPASRSGAGGVSGSAFRTPVPPSGAPAVRPVRAVSWPLDEASEIEMGVLSEESTEHRRRQRHLRGISTAHEATADATAPTPNSPAAPPVAASSGMPAVAIVQEVGEAGVTMSPQRQQQQQRPMLPDAAVAAGQPTTLAIVQTAGPPPLSTHSRRPSFTDRLKAILGFSSASAAVPAPPSSSLTAPLTPPRGSPAGGFAATAATTATEAPPASNLRRHQAVPSDGLQEGFVAVPVSSPEGDAERQEAEDRKLLRPADSNAGAIVGATSMFFRGGDLSFLRDQPPGVQGVVDRAPRRPYADSDDSEVLTASAQQQREREMQQDRLARRQQQQEHQQQEQGRRALGQPRQPSDAGEELSEGGLSLNAAEAARMQRALMQQQQHEQEAQARQQQQQQLLQEPKKKRRMSSLGGLCHCWGSEW